ncbi:MAG: ABC transporter substrate-binding protein [Emergencia sp.]
MLKENKGNKFIRLFDYLHEHIIVIIIVVVVLAGAISIIFILRDKDTKQDDQQTNMQYEDADTVYFAMDHLASLNPLSSEDSDTYYISQLLFSSLFRLDGNLNVEGDLVSDYETDAEAGKVDLTLREGVKFSDGSSLTATDVYYTVNQIWSIGKKSPYYQYVSKIKSVNVSGSRSLSITFESPQDAALDNLVFPIVSASDYDRDADKVLGSGPYRYKSYNSKKYLRLEPNTNYYGTKAENQLEFNVIKDKNAVTGLMTMDAVTAYVSRSQNADVDAEDKGLNVTALNSAETEFLGFNFNNTHLKKKEFRQAVAKAIDTQALIDENFGGSAITSDSIYFPGFLGTENQGDPYPEDQKGAADLFKACGYKDTNEDGILEDENGKNVTLTLLVNSGNSGRVDCAVSIKNALEKVGIEVTVKQEAWDEYKKAVEDGDFQMYLGGYQFDKKYDLRTLFSSAAKNGFDSDKIQSKVKQLETCLSAEGQKEVFSELESLLKDELPFYSICNKTYSFITVSHFESQGTPTYFDVFRGCGNWNWQKTLEIKDEKETESEETSAEE